MNNGKKVRQLPPVSEDAAHSRIAGLLGSSFAEHVIDIDNNRNGLHLHGWIGKPFFSRSQTDMQFFFVNGRIVKDKVIAHAVRRAYSDVMQSGRHPGYILFNTRPSSSGRKCAPE